MHQSASVDEHINGFSGEVKKRLEKLRAIIQKAAPKAEQCIGYGIPTFKLEGNLVHFAGYKNHIGFYPGSSGIANFSKELAGYETSKGAVQFRHDQPLPFALVSQIVRFRVIENEEKAEGKKKTAKPAKARAKKTAAPKQTDAQAVTAWMNAQDDTVKKEINAVRKLIKAAGPQLKERIKWNAPSYYIEQDLLTFGPSKNKKIVLVFHHPAVVKIKSALLEGNYKDRRLVKFDDAKQAKSEQKELARVIQELVKLSSKK